ncbi:MAG: hypothetical protein PHZ26_03620 [Candidatus Gracilibacteria bacterium]|nr:hypothetical protein [Candidatus Gracilibacteria bacterium]MDD2908816.1 hypothetical protein [Candidatus Gracilibacteria bacterium]
MSETKTNLDAVSMLNEAENNEKDIKLKEHLEEIRYKLSGNSINPPSKEYIISAFNFLKTIKERKTSLENAKGQINEDSQLKLSRLRDELDIYATIQKNFGELGDLRIKARDEDHGDDFDIKNYLITKRNPNGSFEFNIKSIKRIRDENFTEEDIGTSNTFTDIKDMDKYLVSAKKPIIKIEEAKKEEAKKEEKKKPDKKETSKGFEDEKTFVAKLLGINDLSDINLISAFKTIRSVNGNIGDTYSSWKSAGYIADGFFGPSEFEQLNDLLRMSKDPKNSKTFSDIAYFIEQGKTINDYKVNIEQTKKLNKDNVFVYLSDRSYNNVNLISGGKDYKANKSDGIITEAFLLNTFNNEKDYKLNNIVKIIKMGGYNLELPSLSSKEELVELFKNNSVLKEYFLKGIDSLGTGIKAFLKNGQKGYEDNLDSEKAGLEKVGLAVGQKIDDYLTTKNENDPKLTENERGYIKYLKENKPAIVERLKFDFIGAYASFLSSKKGGGIGTSMGFESSNEFLKHLNVDFTISIINGVPLPTIGLRYSNEVAINEKGDWLINGSVGTILVFPYGTLGIRKITNIDDFKNISNVPPYTESVIAGLYAGTGRNFSLAGAGFYVGASKDYSEGINIGEKNIENGLSSLLDGLKKVSDLEIKKKEILSKIDSEELNPKNKAALKIMTENNLNKFIAELKPQLEAKGFDDSKNKDLIIDGIKEFYKNKFRETSGMVAGQEQDAYRLLGFIPTFGYRYSGFVIGANILGFLSGGVIGTPVFAGIEGQKVNLEYKENEKDRLLASLKEGHKINLSGNVNEITQKLSDSLSKKVEYINGVIVIYGIEDLKLHIQSGANVQIKDNNLYVGDLGENEIFYQTLDIQDGTTDKKLFIGKSKNIPEINKEEMKKLETNTVKPFVLETQINSNVDLNNKVPENIRLFIENNGFKFHTLLQNGNSKTFKEFAIFTACLDEGNLEGAKKSLIEFLNEMAKHREFGISKNELADLKNTINTSTNTSGIYSKFKQYFAADAYSIEKVGKDDETKEHLNERVNEKRERLINEIKKALGYEVNGEGDIVSYKGRNYDLRTHSSKFRLIQLRDAFERDGKPELGKKAKILEDLNMNNKNLYVEKYPGAGRSRKKAFESFLTKTQLSSVNQKNIQEGYEKLQGNDNGWTPENKEVGNSEPVAKTDNTFALMWDSKIATGGKKAMHAGSYFSAMPPGYVEFADGKTTEIQASNDIIGIFQEKSYYKQMFDEFKNHFESQGVKLNETNFNKLLLNGSTEINGKKIVLSRKFIVFGYGICNNPSIGLVLGDLIIGENKPFVVKYSEGKAVITNKPVITDKKVALGAATSVGGDSGVKKDSISTLPGEREVDTNLPSGGNRTPTTQTGGGRG